MLAIGVGALAAIVVGALDPVGSSRAGRLFGLGLTLSWWVRTLLTGCFALCTLYAPGLWLRARLRDDSWLRSCALVWLPGFLLLAVSGVVAWALSAHVDPQLTVALLTAPAPILLVALLRRPVDRIVAPSERAIALMMMLLLLIGIGRAAWSAMPDGELYGATVSRSLEVGNRSDSRIPYHAVQLVQNHVGPYGEVAESYYSPWSFSDRSPLAGLASVPAVFVAGAEPPLTMPDQAWVPFDPQGFAAYRIAMMAFAATVLVSVYGLLRVRFAESTARRAAIVVALCPFVVHEVYFTWPKLLSASWAFVAALLLVRRRPLAAGVALGFSYLAHPAGLFVVVALGLAWLLAPEAGTFTRRDPPLRWTRRVQDVAVLGAGMGLVVGAWMLANRGHLDSTFVGYLTDADGRSATSVDMWVRARLASLGNTFVPFRLWIADADNLSVVSLLGPTSRLVTVGFSYWSTVPFGVGLVFFPWYVLGLGRALWRAPVAVTSIVVAPLIVFWLYWGSTITGMTREGLHCWFVASVVVAFFGLRSMGSRVAWECVRWVASARVVEVLVMLLAPAMAATGIGEGPRFVRSDVLAVGLMVGAVLALGVLSARWLRAAEGTVRD